MDKYLFFSEAMALKEVMQLTYDYISSLSTISCLIGQKNYLTWKIPSQWTPKMLHFLGVREKKIIGPGCNGSEGKMDLLRISRMSNGQRHLCCLVECCSEVEEERKYHYWSKTTTQTSVHQGRAPPGLQNWFQTPGDTEVSLHHRRAVKRPSPGPIPARPVPIPA